MKGARHGLESVFKGDSPKDREAPILAGNVVRCAKSVVQAQTTFNGQPTWPPTTTQHL